MRVSLESSALVFLNSRKYDEVTVNVIDLEVNCCLGRAVETKITFDSPYDENVYNCFYVHGIKFNLSKILMLEDNVKIALSGFEPFKSLELTGFKVL